MVRPNPYLPSGSSSSLHSSIYLPTYKEYSTPAPLLVMPSLSTGNVSSGNNIHTMRRQGGNALSGGNASSGNVSSQCVVRGQCVVRECVVTMRRQGVMRRQGGMRRQGMCRHNASSGGNACNASSGNVSSQCVVRG